MIFRPPGRMPGARRTARPLRAGAITGWRDSTPAPSAYAAGRGRAQRDRADAIELYLDDKGADSLSGIDEPGIAEHRVRLPDGIDGQASEIC